ncbi:hypothetical protein [Aliarcobacter cryaerophilus]|uniref:Uncharacterized protein n=1 Tax=Aliarcobacter cryaerophilus TaxID=28198 RepID=A0A2S9TFH5_9BACT|nr:hypothetical protein [Aliarcobacter cryaerophilus]PRM97588.1 hypothetical protein CJ670_05210 [Arcobacter cryaerophilus gv. crypticus]
MQKRYSITLKNFLENKKFNNKSFFINANDELVLENDNKKVDLGIFFKLILSKKSNDLKIEISLYSWSNIKQSLVPIDKSIWKDFEFGAGKHIPKIEKHYKSIIDNFLNIFKELKYYWHLKELIHKMEHPIFNFHYKLLNTFSKKSLEDICLKHFNNYPILNVAILKTKVYDRIHYLFLPNYVNGFYIFGIEASVDLDETDYAIIENDSKEILMQECLKLLGVEDEKN